MRILVLAPDTAVLTGGGTYTANVLRYLQRRHDLRLVGPNDPVVDRQADVAYAPNLMDVKPRLIDGLMCPLVVDVHDYYWTRFYPFWCPDLPLRFVAQKLRHATHSAVLKRAAAAITHCEYVYDRIPHPNRHLVRYAIEHDPAEVVTPLPERPNVILFVGQNYFRKGLRLLLLALPQVIQTVPDVRLLVAGYERPHTLVVAQLLARQLPVSFLGAVPRDDVAPLYRSSSVYVIPSEIEASPFTILEAGIAGTPTVATAVGGMPEMIQHQYSGLLVPRGDVQALSESITSLLTDPELAGRLAEQSRLRAISRTPEMMANEVLQVLESAAGRSRNRGVSTDLNHSHTT